MFFEQNHIEAELASARFMALTGRADREPEVFAAKVAAGRRSLESVARGLADGRPFLCGDAYTVADIALHAYVHCAGDAGADPAEHAGIERVAAPRGGDAAVRERPRADPAPRDAAAGLTPRVSRVTRRRTHADGDRAQPRRVESIIHRGGAMPKVPKRVTDDTIQVRQVSHYQFTWVAGESGASGTWTLQLVLDQGAWEEVVTVDAEDADVLQDLLSTAGTVYYDVARQTLMFGTTLGRQRLRPGPHLPEGGRRPPGPAPQGPLWPVRVGVGQRDRADPILAPVRALVQAQRRIVQHRERLGMEHRRCRDDPLHPLLDLLGGLV